MKIQLFILPSRNGNAGRYKTIGSFPQECIAGAVAVSDYMQINAHPKAAPWFGVFYDNEYIDLELKKNIKTFLMTIGNNALVMYKKNYVGQSLDWCPRIFRSNLELLSPFQATTKIEYEKILNGWICEHGHN